MIGGYMLLALVWWGILLIRNNAELYHVSEALIERQFDQNSVRYAEEAQKIEQEYKSNQRMIIGEGFVFAIALLFGMRFIYKAYRREIETMREKRNFLLAITHELKSPLASIGLIFETVQARKLQSGQLNNLVTNGIEETERLKILIENLLLSARLEQSYQPEFEALDLLEILSNVIRDIQTKNPEIVIIQHLEVKQMNGSFDRHGIYSLFHNLLENAIKYNMDDRNITVTATQDDRAYLIAIADQGVGIPNHEKEKVFRQFYRSGQEDTRQTKGTGIGLFIVDKIIELHRGKIVVEDNTPSGVIFKISLPK